MTDDTEIDADDISYSINGITPVQQMISSCTGAVITSLFVTPLDVVKIRLQSQKSPLQKGQCFNYCNGLMDHTCICLNGNSSQKTQWYKRPVPRHFTGTLDAFIKIPKYEGITSLWSGLPPTLVMAVPATVIYFTCYEWCRKAIGYSGAMKGVSDNTDWWKPMAAGATARTWAVTVISPLEMVRTKMQSEQIKYIHMWQALKNTVRHEGVITLWKGLGPTLLRDVPFSALYWMNYEGMKAKVMKVRGTDQLTFMESFTAGAISGSIAGFITLPFDVIKTHRQIELGESISLNKNSKKVTTSTWLLISKLYRQQGLQALFTGLVPRLVKVAPACAIMISSYEYFKSFFRAHNQHSR